MWDPRPLVSQIHKKEFAMFITKGNRGEEWFDNLFTPTVADAIDLTYPLKDSIAGLTIHLPAKETSQKQ